MSETSLPIRLTYRQSLMPVGECPLGNASALSMPLVGDLDNAANQPSLSLR